jgi:hypothetical protein
MVCDPPSPPLLPKIHMSDRKRQSQKKDIAFLDYKKREKYKKISVCLYKLQKGHFQHSPGLNLKMHYKSLIFGLEETNQKHAHELAEVREGWNKAKEIYEHEINEGLSMICQLKE